VRNGDASTIQSDVALLSGQGILGEGIGADFTVELNGVTTTLLAAGTAPAVGRSSAGATITLGENNVLRGLAIGSSNGAAIAGTAFGTLTTGELYVSATGPALSLENGTLAGTFAQLSSTNSTGRGLSLVNVGGTLAPAAGGISGAAGEGVYVEGGTVAVSYPGNITNAAGRAVRVTGRTAGAITISGAISDTGTGILVDENTGGSVSFTGSAKSISTGAGAGVTLTNNTGATIGFSGGGLAITTTTGNGFSATGGGSVTVTGAGNSINSTGGTAVNVAGTTIGDGGIVFVSVSADGAVPGIVLDGTGGTHGLLVTGDGATPGSGGTINNTAGYGIALTTTGANDLRFVNVTGAGGGISGSSFGALAVNTVSVATTGAPALNLATGTVSGTFPSVNVSGSSGHGVSLNGVGGTWTVAGGTVTGSANGAALFVTGDQGAGTLNWQAALSQSNAHPTLSVATHSNGTLNVTGTVASTGSSTGLRFSDADANYNVSPSGATTLSGSGGAVAILSGSSGTFVFSGNLNAAYASGSVAPFAVNSSNPSVTFNGNLTTNGATGRLVDVTSQSGGSITFQNGTLSASSGTGILLNSAAGTVNFNGTTTLNGGDAGIDVENNSSGTISFASGSSVTNPTGEAIRIVSSSPTFTYTGAFSKTNAGTGILVQSSGGTIAFNGSGVTKTLSTSTGNAVNLLSNSGTVTFSGGGLAITTTSGAGFNATGGGTVQLTGASNTVNATGGGTAVNVQNTTIGGSGLTFQSVSASGGGSGIVLVSTGAGGLQVTGAGTHGSGGTVVNSSGADGAIAGNGVYIQNATGVTLNWMNLSGHANHAVRGVSVSNVNLNRLRITGTNGTNVSFDEGSVSFDNLTGTASITSSFITGGFEDNVRVVNTSGTLNRLTMTNDTIGHNGNTGNNGVLVDGRGTAVVNATIQNSRFTGARANLIGYTISENAAGDVVISGNVGTNNHPNKLGSDFGFYVAHASNGAVTYQVSGNSVNDAGGAGIEVDRLAGGTGAMTGSITNNNVGTAGVANSGSSASSTLVVGIGLTGTTATHTTTITGNTLRQYTNYGIRLINRGTGNGYLNATVQNNNIQEPSPNAAAFGAYSALRAELGASSAGPDDGRTCLHIIGNTMNQAAGSTQATLRIFGRFGTRTALPGLVGDANTFLAGQNTITGTATPVNATSTNPFQSSCPPV
jgi:hypothetical protein